MSKTILLSGGGIDSFLELGIMIKSECGKREIAYAQNPPVVRDSVINILCIDYGQRAFEAELMATRDFVAAYHQELPFIRLNLFDFKAQDCSPFSKKGPLFDLRAASKATNENSQVRSRNEYLITSAMRQGFIHKEDNVHLGIPHGGKYIDGQLDYYSHIMRLLDIQIKSSIYGWVYKDDLLKLWYKIYHKYPNIVVALMRYVISCHNPTKLTVFKYRGCGYCHKCESLESDKQYIEYLVGIKDLIVD